MPRIKKITKRLIRSYWVTLFIGISFSFFIWLSWKKFSEWIGDSTIVWIIAGVIVLIGIFIGKFSFKRVANKFTN